MASSNRSDPRTSQAGDHARPRSGCVDDELRADCSLIRDDFRNASGFRLEAGYSSVWKEHTADPRCRARITSRQLPGFEIDIVSRVTYGANAGEFQERHQFARPGRGDKFDFDA